LGERVILIDTGTYWETNPLTLSERSLQRQQSLQEQAYQTLRQAILSGELKAGDRLVETQLANRLQVSRTPIREALRLLHHESLVTADEGGVLRVSTISASDAIQLYDCRIALECLSVKGACQNATDDQIAALLQVVLQSEQLRHHSPDSEDRLLDLDYRFHRMIAQSSGNHWLVSLLEQVFDKMLLLRLQTTHHNPQVMEIRVEHRRIVEAIAQKSEAKAIAAIEEHLIASKIRVVREVQEMQNSSKSKSTSANKDAINL
jgi:DNA-binding GntR family transcriptional regulator